jgi:hypothetical protein
MLDFYEKFQYKLQYPHKIKKFTLNSIFIHILLSIIKKMETN